MATKSDNDMRKIATSICYFTGYSTEVEFVFVVDVSITLTYTELTAQLSFVNGFINSMGIDQVGSRCGLVTYSSTVLTVFGLTSYQRREEVIEAVSRVTLMEGSGRTDLALRRMMLMLKESRVGSSQVAVVFFHGQSSNMAATRELAEVARKKGIVVLAVGIGSGVDERELGYIAGKKEFEFKVESHDRLNDLLVRLTTKTMNVVRHFEASEPSSIIGPGIDEGKRNQWRQSGLKIGGCSSGFKT